MRVTTLAVGLGAVDLGSGLGASLSNVASPMVSPTVIKPNCWKCANAMSINCERSIVYVVWVCSRRHRGCVTNSAVESLRPMMVSKSSREVFPRETVFACSLPSFKA